MTANLSDEEIAKLIDETRSASPGELFAAAWHGVEEGPNGDLLRNSLVASASQIPELAVVLNEMLRPNQGILDVRVLGESIVGHSAIASEFGKVVRQFAESIKQISKSMTDRARLKDRLLVTGALEGSVRIIFTIAPETKLAGHMTTIENETEAIETKALSRLVLLMEQAETSSTLLDQSIQNLRQPARDAVKSLARSITKNEWDLVGNLLLPSGERTPLNLTVQGGDRLFDALQEHPVDRTKISVSGVIDGWTWSRRSMTFLPDNGPRFEALVDDPDLEETVGSLHAIRQLQVDAEFEVLIVSLTGNLNLKRTSHKLVAIAPHPTQPTMIEAT